VLTIFFTEQQQRNVAHQQQSSREMAAALQQQEGISSLPILSMGSDVGSTMYYFQCIVTAESL